MTKASTSLGRAIACLLVAMSAAAAIALVLAPAASAVWVTAAGRKIDVERLTKGPSTTPNPLVEPLDSIFQNLEFHGGEVVTSLTTYTIYWDPSGAEPYPASYESGINQYFTDLEHDSDASENGQSVVAEYNASSGQYADYDPRFGGTFKDTDAFPSNGCKEFSNSPVSGSTCLTTAQLYTEADAFIASKKLPTTKVAMYFLELAPGVSTCSIAEETSKEGQECSPGTKHTVFCTYHGYSGEGFLFSPQPYTVGTGCGSPERPNGSPSDAAISDLTHELDEAITDPHVSAWFDGTQSPPNGGGEIGDQCNLQFAPTGTAPNGQGYDEIVNGHYYDIQRLWSNDGHACLTGISDYSQISPIPTFSSTEVAKDEMSFTALRSPFVVAHYAWNFGEGAAPTETSAETVTHLYGKGIGAYRPTLTEYTENGTGIGTVRTIGVGIPTIERAAATDLGPATATLNGRVNPNGAALSSCTFEYGTSTSYGQTASCRDVGAVNTPESVSAAIGGLSPNTVYHYLLLAKNANGEAKGEDGTFTTTKALAPTVQTKAASEVTSSSVRLNGTVNPKGSNVTSCVFEYGTTTSYGKTIGCATSPGSGIEGVMVDGQIGSGLAAGTTYHYRISATNSSGTSKGGDVTFKTS